MVPLHPLEDTGKVAAVAVQPIPWIQPLGRLDGIHVEVIDSHAAQQLEHRPERRQTRRTGQVQAAWTRWRQNGFRRADRVFACVKVMPDGRIRRYDSTDFMDGGGLSWARTQRDRVLGRPLGKTEVVQHAYSMFRRVRTGRHLADTASERERLV